MAKQRKKKIKESEETLIKSDKFIGFYPPFVRDVGRPLSYQPEELLEKFQEYIQWAEEHPIENIFKTSGVSYSGDHYGNTNTNFKPRLISIGGFLVHIGQTESWWKMLEEGKRGKEFLKVKEKIKAYCESFQKEMAASGIFKENIISRLLGLKDKQQVENTGEGLRIVVNSQEEMKRIEGMKDLEI